MDRESGEEPSSRGDRPRSRTATSGPAAATTAITSAAGATTTATSVAEGTTTATTTATRGAEVTTTATTATRGAEGITTATTGRDRRRRDDDRIMTRPATTGTGATTGGTTGATARNRGGATGAVGKRPGPTARDDRIVPPSATRSTKTAAGPPRRPAGHCPGRSRSSPHHLKEERRSRPRSWSPPPPRRQMAG